MSKIPKAEEFFDFESLTKKLGTDKSMKQVCAEAAIELTKLHVEAALKTAYDNAEFEYNSQGETDLVKESILNAYPLENIK